MSSFAQRMKARREGLVLCEAGCNKLFKPDELHEGAECSPCRSVRIQRELEEREKEAQKRRLERIKFVRNADMNSLKKEDLIILAVAEGHMTVRQSEEGANLSVKQVRQIITGGRQEQERAQARHAENLQQRIAMSTKNRVGKTRAVLSEALQRGEGKHMYIAVVDQAALDHYNLQIQTLIPHAQRMYSDKKKETTWEVGTGKITVSYNIGHVGMNTLADPDCTASVSEGLHSHRRFR